MGCTASSSSLPGGFTVGEHVYYSGSTRQGRYGELVFGAVGEVSAGSCRGEVIVDFGDNIGCVKVKPLEVARKAPAIPGGFKLGELVFYGGPARKYPNGDRIWFSATGTVVGRSCVGDGLDGERLAVLFQDHKDAKAVRLTLLSREAPVIPGGYKVGDHVYWCGMNWTFPNGDRLKFGAEGEVAGRSCVGDGLDDERVAVNFHGNRGAVAMRLPEISLQPPVIPGGFSIGDKVYYAYPNWRAPDGHLLLFGVQGKVIGRSCIGDGKDDERVWVLFPGLGYGCICLEQISRDPPVIPGGYNLGDLVYFCGPSRPAGCNGDKLTFGQLGEVAGRATCSRPGHRADVAVVFPGNEDAADVRLAELSRELPSIPGGFTLGDEVFYSGPDWTYSNGDRLTYGAKGEVVGRSCQGDGKDDERAAVLLPGNRVAAHLRLAEISRDPPPGLSSRLAERLLAAQMKAACPSPRRRRQQRANSEPRSTPRTPSMMLAHSLDESSAADCISVEQSPPTVPVWGGKGSSMMSMEIVAPTGDEHMVQVGGISTPPTTPMHGAAGKGVVGDFGNAGVSELAVVYRTARGAGVHDVAEAARKACFAQVDQGHEEQDMALLAELRRAAEDTEWKELWQYATDALENVALPHVLETAKLEGDLFGLLAVSCRAKMKAKTTKDEGLQKMAHDAEACVRSINIGPDDLRELSTDRLLLRKKGVEGEESLVAQMQCLLDETYNGWGGFGKRTRTRDRPNEKVADRLEVESVVRLRNMGSYLSYLIRRQVISAEMPEESRKDWNVRTCGASPTSKGSRATPRSEDPDSPMGSTQQLAKSLLGPLATDLNEYYLWHGTGPAEAQGIANSGFDLDQAGSCRGALFGRGLYFAESCLKADEYVRADDEGRFPLLLCRVTLGHVNYCDAEDPWELREALRVSCRDGAGGHHSVLGDREKVRQTFREFVIFDGFQAYPEYIVWYRRDGGDRSSAQGQAPILG